MEIFVRIFVILFTVVVLIAGLAFIVLEANDKLETLKEKAPWFVKFVERRESLNVLVAVCIFMLLGNGYELVIKEMPEVPSPPVVSLKSPSPPPITITQISPPAKEQCWINNYAVPSISSPQPWGMATVVCNATIRPPFSVEFNYDQSAMEVGLITFPAGKEFAKYEEHNEGTKVVAMFDLHSIVPNEPFSIMSKGASDKFPLVKTGIIRAKGRILEFHP